MTNSKIETMEVELVVTLYWVSGQKLQKALHIIVTDLYSSFVRKVINIHILQMQNYLPLGA